MAGIDKIYGTQEQYYEFLDWCTKNKPDATGYFYSADGYPESLQERPISNFPEKIDRWLIENCEIPFVQKRLQQQYGYIKQDILKVDRGIICHQVNCQQVMGAGLALQIKINFPQVYKEFKNEIPFLGLCLLTCVKKDLYVASLYGQNRYGTDKQHTDYVAIENSLEMLKNWIKIERIEDLPVYVPYGLGCGLGGGENSIVEEMIYDYFPDSITCKK